MEHSDLVSEMAQVEHLTTQERLHLARRRRMQQLKLWQQREKEWLRSRAKREKSNKRSIYFSDSVMLLEAAARNDIDEVRRLLSRGVTPDATNEDGLTALHQCCIDNNEAMMRLLLDHGANVNAEDSEKWTPLHAAATCGNLNLVRILIQRGANLLAVNGDGNMPYDICEEERTLDAIESEMAARGVTQRLIDDTRASTEMKMLRDVDDMVKGGMDLDEPRDGQGATLLHIASANGYIKVVEYLLEHRAATDVVDHDMWQPVHAAACWGHLEVLELLVQYGADLNVRNKHDETPADICEEGELRARILRLAADQEELRRHAAADRLRTARRSSSSASTSRVRSVRRTSLREKQLTAKADVRGEAKLRETFDSTVDDDLQGLSNGVENDQNTANLQPLELSHKRLSNSSTTSNQSYDSTVEYAVPKHSYSQRGGSLRTSDVSDLSDLTPYGQQKTSNPLFGVNAASHYAPGSVPAPQHEAVNEQNKHYERTSLPNGVRKAPEGQDNDLIKNEDALDGRKELIVSPNQIAITEGGTATYTTDNNGKINVHVTVMINAGTLADLKKQRSQIRTNGSPVESSLASTNNHSLNSLSEASKVDMPVQLNPLSAPQAALLHDVDIPTKKATFGMGCFWSNDSLFGVTPGVIRTRVGYSGGTTKNPHYRSLGDHTEVIELDFDPKAVTYEVLLDMFWANHEYGLTTKLKRQYQSLILYHDEEQRLAAEASYKQTQERCKDQLRTEIAPAGLFYPAEDYHQKYRLQGHKDLCRSLGMDSSKLQTSHLAARLNGYLVGVGGRTQFEQEVQALGLSEKQAEYVRRELERNEGGGLAC